MGNAIMLTEAIDVQIFDSEIFYHAVLTESFNQLENIDGVRIELALQAAWLLDCCFVDLKNTVTDQWLGSTVHLAAVADTHHQNTQTPILNTTDNTIIAYAVLPERSRF